jgi:hypothetical protein
MRTSALLLLLVALVMSALFAEARVYRAVPSEACEQVDDTGSKVTTEGNVCCQYGCPNDVGLKKKFCTECGANEFCTLEREYAPDAGGNC